MQNGDLVTLADGDVYKYVGTGEATLDLNAQTFTGNVNWTQVGFGTTASNGGVAQNAPVVAGDTVTVGANYNVATYQASQGVKTLNLNNTVESAQGVIYQYIGAPGAQVDLSSANFSDATTWRRLASAGDVYTYIGPVGSGGTINVNNQNYSNTSLWLPVNTAVQTGLSYKVTNAATQSRIVALGDTVTTTTGLVYRYVGATATLVDINSVNYATSSSWVLGPTPVQTGFTNSAAQGASPQSQTLIYGDTVTLTAGYIVPQFTSSQGVESLTQNTTTVAAANGAVYTYIGSSGSVNLSTTNFGNALLWQAVPSSGDVYRYIGQTQALDVNNTNYANASLWQQVVPGASAQQLCHNLADAADSRLLPSKTRRSRSTAVAAALAISVGGGFGVAIAGGGAVAENDILAQTTAEIENSTLGDATGTTLGAVNVSATDTSTIKSFVLAAAASVAVGGDAGVAAAIGISVARNIIGDGTDSVPVSNESAAGTGLTTNAGQVQAEVFESNVYSTSKLSVVATSNETISADVIAVSTAIAGGTVGVGVAAGGTWVDNQSDVATSALIVGDGSSTHIETGAVTVDAEDTSRIEAIAIAGALSAGFGAVGVAISIGVSIAANTINDPVMAEIESVPTLNTGSGAVLVKADEAAKIDGLVAAAALSISAGGVAASLAGGGAYADNTIDVDTSALVSGSTLGNSGTVGNVTVEAMDTAIIAADVASVAAAFAIGGVGVGVAVGISVAQNLIGDGTVLGVNSDGANNGANSSSGSTTPTVTTTKPAASWRLWRARM